MATRQDHAVPILMQSRGGSSVQIASIQVLLCKWKYVCKRERHTRDTNTSEKPSMDQYIRMQSRQNTLNIFQPAPSTLPCYSRDTHQACLTRARSHTHHAPCYDKNRRRVSRCNNSPRQLRMRSDCQWLTHSLRAVGTPLVARLLLACSQLGLELLFQVLRLLARRTAAHLRAFPPPASGYRRKNE